MNYQAYIEQSLQSFVPAKSKWNYEDGCALQGAAYLYEVTGDSRYKDFIQSYLRDFVSPEGEIRGFRIDEYNIDSIHPGRLLLLAVDWEPSDPRFAKALEQVRAQLDTHPRTEEGNFWHKKIYPWQVWLDGLYMAQPFYARYDTIYGGMSHYQDIVSQFQNVRKRLFVEEKQLYIHAYDEQRAQPWADPVTGHSPNFWLRAIGWFLVAIVDTYAEISETIFEAKEAFVPLMDEAVRGLMPYMHPDKFMFYDLVDLPELEGNYLETSGSAMVAFALLKASRLGMIDKEVYEPIGRKILQAVHDQRLIQEDGSWKLTGMVEVSGLGPGDKRDGSVEYYLSEPVVADDHKGMGAFMMAWSELLRLGGDEVKR